MHHNVFSSVGMNGSNTWAEETRVPLQWKQASLPPAPKHPAVWAGDKRWKQGLGRCGFSVLLCHSLSHWGRAWLCSVLPCLPSTHLTFGVGVTNLISAPEFPTECLGRVRHQDGIHNNHWAEQEDRGMLKTADRKCWGQRAASQTAACPRLKHLTAVLNLQPMGLGS